MEILPRRTLQTITLATPLNMNECLFPAFFNHAYYAPVKFQTLQNPQCDIENEYKLLQTLFRRDQVQKQLFQSHLSNRNRYTDILPYKHSRVKLRYEVNNYINACYIDSPMGKQKLIAS